MGRRRGRGNGRRRRRKRRNHEIRCSSREEEEEAKDLWKREELCPLNVCVWKCVSVCIYLCPQAIGCVKWTTADTKTFFLSHREHIVPGNYFKSFKLSGLPIWWIFCIIYHVTSAENTNCFLFCFFFPSYLLNFTANTYSFIIIILVISPLSSLVCEIKSFPKSNK